MDNIAKALREAIETTILQCATSTEAELHALVATDSLASLFAQRELNIRAITGTKGEGNVTTLV